MFFLPFFFLFALLFIGTHVLLKIFLLLLIMRLVASFFGFRPRGKFGRHHWHHGPRGHHHWHRGPRGHHPCWGGYDKDEDGEEIKEKQPEDVEPQINVA